MLKSLRPAIRSAIGIGASSLGFAAGQAMAADAQPELEEIVVVGTRTAGHSVDESLAPIDLITPEAIRQSASLPGEIGAADRSGAGERRSEARAAMSMPMARRRPSRLNALGVVRRRQNRTSSPRAGGGQRAVRSWVTALRPHDARATFPGP